MVYQTQMPMQQQTNDYYSKNMYKPQNPPFHLFYQMEVSLFKEDEILARMI